MVHFWSKISPPELRLVEHHRVSNFVMAISCKKLGYYLLQLLLIIKNLLFKFLFLISPYVETQEFIIKFILQTQFFFSNNLKLWPCKFSFSRDPVILDLILQLAVNFTLQDHRGCFYDRIYRLAKFIIAKIYNFLIEKAFTIV